jgi:hypothetical protein
MKISPKVYVPVGVAIVVGIALAIITGDTTFLSTVPISLVAGGAGVAVNPAPGVTQKAVQGVSERRSKIVPASTPPPARPASHSPPPMRPR